MDEISVRGAKLDRAEPGRVGANRSRRERLLQRLNAFDAQFLRRRVSPAERDRARPDGPPPPLRLGNAALPGPRAIDVGLPPGVGELNAWDGALRPDEPGDPLQRLEVLFAPDAEILRRNPSFGRDRRRLGEDEARAADRSGGEMGEMPVIGKTVVAGILAHRRHADAIGEGDVAQSEIVEQVGHRALFLGSWTVNWRRASTPVRAGTAVEPSRRLTHHAT